MKAGKPIKEIMTRKLITITPDTPVKAIKRLFEKNNFHHLPVLDLADNLVGLVSKEDFSKIAYVFSLEFSKDKNEPIYDNITAKDIMTACPLSLDPEDTIGLAADIILANKFHALPIIDNDNLVGLITSHDLLRYSFNGSMLEQEIH